ncbi:membrane protein [Sphingobacterium alkalisoli]|nr:membrane protein [Sphingobacterium alkalisoli]
MKSDARLVRPDDLESLQQILDASQNMNFNICAYGEVAADDYFLKQASFNSLADEQKRAYVWENYVYNFNNDWARAYYTVFNANTVLDRLGQIERTPANSATFDAIKGAALYFRALQYLSLVWTYARAYNSGTAEEDLGIVLRTSANFNDPSSRSSVAASYTAILADLKAAEDLVPASTAHVMRPSKSAVYGSLARTYLSMARYDSAYYYSNALLQVNDQLLDFNENDDMNSAVTYPFSRFNRETVFYAELTTANPQIGESNLRIDTNLYGSYSDDDLRKVAYFRLNTDGYRSYRGSYSSANRMFGGIATNEMYLIRAECAARMGKAAEALKDLNILLKHRFRHDTFQPLVVDNDQEVLTLILQERRKELIFRGLRWMDIKRLNETGSSIRIERKLEDREYTLMPGDNRFALPIPDDVIKLSGMPQNPI